jgi:hypothetical protein
MWIAAAFLHVAWALTLAKASVPHLAPPEVSCSVPFDRAPRALAGVEPHYIESDHFAVSYYTEGPDSVFGADLPSELLADLETSYRVLSEDPRCRMYVPAGIYDAADGGRKILARVERQEPGFGGHAICCLSFNDPPCANSGAGYMIIGRHIRARSDLRLIAAHELMHLFQYAMDPDEPAWAKESTARWTEGFVFPADKRRVDSYASFVHHRASIWTSRESVIYSPHFWDFLERVLADAIPPEVWAKACDLDWMEALRQTLVEHGTDLDTMLHAYAVWNYRTGRRATAGDPRVDLPEIEPDRRYANYPVVDAALGDAYAEEAGSNYLFFTGLASRVDLHIRLKGAAGWLAHRTVTWIGTTGENTHVESPSMRAADEEFVVPQWHQYDQIAVIVTNRENHGALSDADLRYTVSAFEAGEPVNDVAWGDSPARLRVENPATRGAAIRLHLPDSTHSSRIAIFDARGRLVRLLTDSVRPGGDYGLYWDGSTETGGHAAAGAYLLVLQQGKSTTTSRFVFMR